VPISSTRASACGASAWRIADQHRGSMWLAMSQRQRAVGIGERPPRLGDEKFARHMAHRFQGRQIEHLPGAYLLTDHLFLGGARSADPGSDAPLCRANFSSPSRGGRSPIADCALPLAHGKHMLPPMLVGRILQALAPQADARVLEIGTGSGYLTACLCAFGATVHFPRIA